MIREGVRAVTGVPGRFESVDEGQGFAVVVDYAHTPDALATVLRAARPLGPGRLSSCSGRAATVIATSACTWEGGASSPTWLS